jgi:hypothetical protein
MGLRTVPLETLSVDAASHAHSDPIATVFRDYPGRVIAGMICFFAFFSIALGLGAWLPNILAERGFTMAKSLNSIFWMTLAFPCAAPGSIAAGCSWYHAGRLRRCLLAQKLEEYTL